MEQNFDCVPCGFTSTNRYNYDIHIRTVKHKARMEGLVCEQCGASYDSRNKLTRHMKNVHVKKEKRINEYLAAVSGTPETEETVTSDTSTSTPLTPVATAAASVAAVPVVATEVTTLVRPVITKKVQKINIRPKLPPIIPAISYQEEIRPKKLITIIPRTK